MTDRSNWQEPSGKGRDRVWLLQWPSWERGPFEEAVVLLLVVLVSVTVSEAELRSCWACCAFRAGMHVGGDQSVKVEFYWVPIEWEGSEDKELAGATQPMYSWWCHRSRRILASKSSLCQGGRANLTWTVLVWILKILKVVWNSLQNSMWFAGKTWLKNLR